jgi:hypothetical protein
MSTWIARTYRGRRLDRNPLRRPSDRAETLVGIWLLVLFAVTAPLIAHAAATTTEHVASDARATALATSHQVTATTVQTAPALVQTPYTLSTSWVNATWTAPDGRRQTGQIQVDDGTRRGSRERIWVSASGNLVPPPLPAWQVRQLAEWAELISFLVVIAVFLTIVAMIKIALNRRSSALIEAEWAVIEPRWNRQRW